MENNEFDENINDIQQHSPTTNTSYVTAEKIINEFTEETVTEQNNKPFVNPEYSENTEQEESTLWPQSPCTACTGD